MKPAAIVTLPNPRHDGDTSVEEALSKRRSVRKYTGKMVPLAHLSQLLWAAQGMTHSEGYRTAPSAGALYPLETYVVAGGVSDLAPGVYKYRPREHDLISVLDGDRRRDLYRVTLDQEAIADAALVIVFTAVFERTTAKYGERGARYVEIEAGHAAQNVCLQAVSLGLGAVPIGAFDDGGVKRVVGCEVAETPLYLLAIGAVG